jgi:hypothetical protein
MRISGFKHGGKPTVLKMRNSLHKTSFDAINGPISRESDSKLLLLPRVGEHGYAMYIPSCINSAAIMCHKSSECEIYARKGN